MGKHLTPILHVLGTGNAQSVYFYNTCFALGDSENFVLVDAGGGNGIFAQLQGVGLPLTACHNLVLTHAHTDHILGAVWVVRRVGEQLGSKKMQPPFCIYGHSQALDALRQMCLLTLQGTVTALFDNQIRFVSVTDGEQMQIEECDFTFFDIGSTKKKQYGFMVNVAGVCLVCAGDEPVGPAAMPYAKRADWLTCEAFCLTGEAEIFRPYQKHHSTAADACKLAQNLKIPHLILWHTEDSHQGDRGQLYLAEGRQQYSGELFVPNDLDTIKLVP